MRLRDDRSKIRAFIHKTLKRERGDWKKPIVQLNGLEVCHPIAVITQVVALEPALRGLVEIKPVLSFSSFSLFPPAVIKSFRVQHQSVFLGPMAERLLLVRTNQVIYFVSALVAFANRGRVRVLPRLIRSYCFMASASDCLGRLDKRVLASSCCCRWNSFR